MSQNKIFIYDDEPARVMQWKSQLERLAPIRSRFVVEKIDTDVFDLAVSQLEQRQSNARKGAPPVPPWGENKFDEAAILVLDFDLLKSRRGGYVTGETAAYLARCYSTCSVIIGVNQFGPNTFDLTLKGHPESYADLNLGEKQLANPGLWKEPWEGFRPWSWPLLPRALDAFQARVGELKGHLDDRMLSFLGFPEEGATILPRSTVEFIERKKNAEETTFRGFVMNSESGLRRKDRPLDDESVARIAAARVVKWLERLVLPGQDILVDAPHLVSRYPSLLTSKRKSLISWNKTATLQEVSTLRVEYRKIEAFRFKKSDWLSRPAWFWHGVSNSPKVAEVVNPWSADRPDYAFCEDISRFLPRDAAREFVADVASPFVRRFVVNPGSKAGRRFAGKIKDVDYGPLSRFSL